ncbi:hypothetical protein D7030_00120 [Flavobacteriaceae bacterium AU392]|nr:hypothetical protein D1817_14315 [Flavobacteriaceae bacterium]RKM86939.1 hypothetical protein D7030_00120 [Flavobacteriaceae bacterium AU392]
MNFEEALKLKLEKQIQNSSDYIIVCPHAIDDPIGNEKFRNDIPKWKLTDLDAQNYSTNGKFGIMDININSFNHYR